MRVGKKQSRINMVLRFVRWRVTAWNTPDLKGFHPLCEYCVGRGEVGCADPPSSCPVNNLNDTTGRPASVRDDLRYFPVGWRLVGARVKGTYYYYYFIDPFRYIQLNFLGFRACFVRIILYVYIFIFLNTHSRMRNRRNYNRSNPVKWPKKIFIIYEYNFYV